MNEMELLRELAQETPLPEPAELDAARARLIAAITTDPATYASAVAQATTDQPGPPADQPAETLRPPAPAPVRTAAKFMHAGAIGTAALLIVVLAFSWDINLYHWTQHGHQDTTAQLRHLRPLLLTVVTAYGLVVTALWLWMARVTSRGRNWARTLSTVLFGLATLQLAGSRGALDVFFAVMTWLTALPAVWLLWRPASSAFFKSANAARPRPPSQVSGP